MRRPRRDPAQTRGSRLSREREELLKMLGLDARTLGCITSPQGEQYPARN
jgi:hypothetical protein